MSNNNINIMDMFGNKNKSNFVIKEISLGEIINDERNFYNTNEIEELKATIKAFGLQQNFTVCKMSDGKYKLISGHRRFKAISELVEEKEINLTTVPCKIEDLTELEQYLLLIISNSTTRELTAYEKAMQVKEVRNIAEQIMQEQDTIKISVREFIKAALKMSDAEVGRYEKINNNLTDDVKEEFEKGNISTDVAYQTSRLPKHKQQEVKEKIVEAEKEDKKITAKDVEEIKKDINDMHLVIVEELDEEELQSFYKEQEDYFNSDSDVQEIKIFEELFQDADIETLTDEIQKEFDSDNDIKCSECEFCIPHFKGSYICSHKDIKSNAEKYEKIQNKKIFSKDSMIAGTKPKKPLEWCPLKNNLSNLDIPTEHNIKIKPKYFTDVKNKLKTFEYRVNDRDYKVGDILNLQEYENDRYTGYVLQVEVTYILKDEYVNENYVIMSIYLIKSMFIDALRNSM